MVYDIYALTVALYWVAHKKSTYFTTPDRCNHLKYSEVIFTKMFREFISLKGSDAVFMQLLNFLRKLAQFYYVHRTLLFPTVYLMSFS